MPWPCDRCCSLFPRYVHFESVAEPRIVPPGLLVFSSNCCFSCWSWEGPLSTGPATKQCPQALTTVGTFEPTSLSKALKESKVNCFSFNVFLGLSQRQGRSEVLATPTPPMFSFSWFLLSCCVVQASLTFQDFLLQPSE